MRTELKDRSVVYDKDNLKKPGLAKFLDQQPEKVSISKTFVEMIEDEE
jgi:hypothetical protein